LTVFLGLLGSVFLFFLSAEIAIFERFE